MGLAAARAAGRDPDDDPEAGSDDEVYFSDDEKEAAFQVRTQIL
jgi:hypothetical protein